MYSISDETYCFSTLCLNVQAFLTPNDSTAVEYSVLRKDRTGSSGSILHPGAELRNAHDDGATTQHKTKPPPTITL